MFRRFSILVVSTTLCLGAAVWRVMPASADVPVTGNPANCHGTLDPGPGSGVTKTLFSTTDNGGTPHTVTYTYHLNAVGPGNGQVAHIIDCGVVVPSDGGNDSITGATQKYSTEQDLAFDVDHWTVSLTVLATERVCDRAKITGTGFDNRSNDLCTGPFTTTSVPAGAIGAVTLAGLLGVIFFTYQLRRERTHRRSVAI